MRSMALADDSWEDERVSLFQCSLHTVLSHPLSPHEPGIKKGRTDFQGQDTFELIFPVYKCLKHGQFGVSHSLLCPWSHGLSSDAGEHLWPFVSCDLTTDPKLHGSKRDYQHPNRAGAFLRETSPLNYGFLFPRRQGRMFSLFPIHRAL